MASRLPVVIAQNAHRAGSAAELEEKLVAELMFAPGLDVSLVHSLGQVHVGGTDHLCLEGFLGNFALCTWEEWSVSASELTRLGISGRLVSRPSSDRLQEVGLATTTATTTKRIYHYDLRQWPDLSKLMLDLRDLLEVRSVQVIPISLVKPMTHAKSSTSDRPIQTMHPEAATPSHSVPTPPSNVLETIASLQNQGSHSGSKVSSVESGVAKAGPLKIDHDDEEPEWAHLDQLVDDLDSSSL